jgi:hypothetical protein
MSAAVSVVTLFSQSYVWFYPRLVPLAGGHKGALLLASLMHWTKRIQQSDPDRGGWIWKTTDEWRAETGLSRHELDAAKAELSTRGILLVLKRGMPARTFFRIDVEVLASALSDLLHLPDGRRIVWTWEHSASMLQLLGRPTAFYTRLACLLDSATDALHMSHLIQSQRSAFTSAITADWISPRTSLIQERTGLSYKQQLASRKRLKHLGVIDQRMSHSMTPKPELRIRFSKVMELLQNTDNKAKNIPDSANQLSTHGGGSSTTSTQVCGAGQGGGTTTTQNQGRAFGQGVVPDNTPAQVCAAGQGVGSSNTPVNRSVGPVFQPSEQLFPFSANRDLPNRQTGISLFGRQEFPFSAVMLAEKGSLYIREKHTEQLPQDISLFGKQDALGSSGGCGGDLDFTGLEVQWHLPGQQLLASSGLAPEVQQAIADEWIGRSSDKRQTALGYPLRYLQRLIDQALLGAFVPELGIAVSAARSSRRRAQQMLDRSISSAAVEMPKPANRSGASEEVTSAANTGVALTERAKLKALTQEFRAKAHGLHQGVGSSNTPAQVRAAGQGVGSSNTPAQVRAAGQGVGSSNTPAQVHAAGQGDGPSITPAQVRAAGQGDGSSITSAQVHAAGQGDGPSITPAQVRAAGSARSLISSLKVSQFPPRR